MYTSGSSPFTIALDDPDIAFGLNEVGVQPTDPNDECGQVRDNRLNFDLTIEGEFM